MPSLLVTSYQVFLFILSLSIVEYFKIASSEIYQATSASLEDTQYGTILPKFDLFFTVGTAYIYETQKATLVWLKFAFMFNDAELKLKKIINKSFLNMVNKKTPLGRYFLIFFSVTAFMNEVERNYSFVSIYVKNRFCQ